MRLIHFFVALTITLPLVTVAEPLGKSLLISYAQLACVRAEGKDENLYVAVHRESISLEENSFSVEYFPINFATPIPFGDRTAERNAIKGKELTVDTTTPLSVIGCDRALSTLRTFTSSRAYTVDSFLERQPLQPNCRAEDSYETCSDQTALYDSALKSAQEKGKDLVIVYGYEGCVWCDSVFEHLTNSEQAQAIREKYLVQAIGTDPINTSGDALVKTLITQAVNGPIPSDFGLPLLILVNVETNAINAFDLGEIEINDYNDDIYIHSYDWINYLLGVGPSCEELKAKVTALNEAERSILASLASEGVTPATKMAASGELYRSAQMAIAFEKLRTEKGCYEPIP